MTYSSEQLIKEFYETFVKKKYPHLEYGEVVKIIESPWRMLKEIMVNLIMENVRFKYFGVFRIKRSRVKGLLDHINIAFIHDKEREEKHRKAYIKFLNENKK